MWKNIVQLGRPQVTIWYKTKYTHSEYLILTAFPLQQWSLKHASMLHYTYSGVHEMSYH